MEKIILRVIENHLKDSAVIGQSQQGFRTGKMCLTHLTSFWDKIALLVDAGQAAGMRKGGTKGGEFWLLCI